MTQAISNLAQITAARIKQFRESKGEITTGVWESVGRMCDEVDALREVFPKTHFASISDEGKTFTQMLDDARKVYQAQREVYLAEDKERDLLAAAKNVPAEVPVVVEAA